MKKINLVLLLIILAFTGCTQSNQASESGDELTNEAVISNSEIQQVFEHLDPDAYVLKTLLPEDGGSDCRLIEVATNKELTRFFVDGIRGEEACTIIGYWGRTLFAQVLPEVTGYMGFYSPYFNFQSINVDTGEVEDLGFFIGWVDQGQLQHQGAFSTNDGTPRALVLHDFAAGKQVSFEVSETFNDLGSPFLNTDDSIVVFTAVESDNTSDFPTLLSTSIFIGNVETGLVEEIYSYEGSLDLTGWHEKEVEFDEDGQTCSIDQKGLNKECQPLSE